MLFISIIQFSLVIFALLVITIGLFDPHDFANFFKKVNIKITLKDLEANDTNLKIKIKKAQNKIESLPENSSQIEDENLKLNILRTKQELTRRKILKLVSNEQLENASQIDEISKLSRFLLGMIDYKIDYTEEPILILIDKPKKQEEKV